MNRIALLVLVLSIGVCATQPAPDPVETVEVLSVVDGDTIRVLVGDGSESVRLIGINAPEREECLYEDAMLRLAALIGTAPVHLEPDQSDRDRFDRLLRYVYSDDRLLNEILVREGLAISRRYEPDTALQETLDAAQAQAQAESLGIWAPSACGEAMGFVGSGEAVIEIADIRYDADGDDNHNLNDEWVEFTNPSSQPLDLTAWRVRDESASHRYEFPDGFFLAAGDTVRLHTGCGTDTNTSLYWCNEGSAVWNNSGDTVFVLDPVGNIVTSVSYCG